MKQGSSSNQIEKSSMPWTYFASKWAVLFPCLRTWKNSTCLNSLETDKEQYTMAATEGRRREFLQSIDHKQRITFKNKVVNEEVFRKLQSSLHSLCFYFYSFKRDPYLLAQSANGLAICITNQNTHPSSFLRSKHSPVNIDFEFIQRWRLPKCRLDTTWLLRVFNACLVLG